MARHKILGIDDDKFLGLIIVVGLIILILILGFSGIDLMSLMIRINQWFYNKLGEWGVYFATFLLSIFGNFTIILPMPYLVSIVTLFLTIPVNPVFLALAAAFGASIGELSAWLFGRGAAEVIDEDTYEKKIKGLVELIRKGLAFPLIVLFAATPLPDDILLIALGMEKYSLKKSLIASFIGKLILVSILLIGAVALKNTVTGNFILYLFGLDISDGVVKSAGDPVVSTITMVVTIIITLIVIMVDWKKLFRRWKRIKKESSSN